VFGGEIKFLRRRAELQDMERANRGVPSPASAVGGESGGDSDDSNRKMGGRIYRSLAIWSVNLGRICRIV
jgi:hypothetical protein